MPNFIQRIQATLKSYFRPGQGEERAATPVPQAVEEEEFLHWGAWHNTPLSTNVSSFLYDEPAQKLTVHFRGVAFYEYYGVNEQEAHAAFIAASAGRWVWDALRVRGTKCMHQKDYVFLPGPSTWKPKHPCPAPRELFPSYSPPKPGTFFGAAYAESGGRGKRRRRN